MSVQRLLRVPMLHERRCALRVLLEATLLPVYQVTFVSATGENPTRWSGSGCEIKLSLASRYFKSRLASPELTAAVGHGHLSLSTPGFPPD